MAVTQSKHAQRNGNGSAARKPVVATKPVPQDDVGGQVERKPLIKMSGLWNNGPGKGMAGSAGSLRFLVFKNGFKQKENDPDFILYCTQNAPRPGGDEAPDADSDEFP